MSVIDVAVVVGYLALMLVIGYFSGKDNESQKIISGKTFDAMDSNCAVGSGKP